MVHRLAGPSWTIFLGYLSRCLGLNKLRGHRIGISGTQHVLFFISGEMLSQRKQIYHQVFTIETNDDSVSAPESQPVAMVKAAAEQTLALPESSTRAISSLWGKISQLPVIQNVAAELKG